LLGIWPIAPEWRNACDVRIGIMTLRCHRLLIILALLALAVTPITAESLIEEPPCFCQVRTTDHRIAQALTRAMRDSPTFRDLVARINFSDVVVYVVADVGLLPSGIDGRLTFVSSTGGYRYVMVRVNTGLPTVRLASLLGHELQHAREVADSDAIVDPASLAREYNAHIGYRQRRNSEGDMFDSSAAIQAGQQVLREVRTAE